MEKYSNAPWEVGQYRDGSYFVKNDNGPICAGTCLQKANARLIAAAPDMHLALRAIADTTTKEYTDFASLAVLLITIAKVALDQIDNQ